MIFNVQSSSLEKFVPITESVIDTYRNRFINNFFFDAKLNKLNIYLAESTTIMNGLYIFTKKSNNIHLVIPENVDIKEFQFVLSHELTHYVIDPLLKISDYCNSDDSYAETKIIRKCDGIKYGIALEENIANFIALIIVSILNDISYEEAKILLKNNFSADELEITETIVAIFNKMRPFEKLIDHFDETVKINKQYETQLNCFLYESLLGGDMSSVICDYDEYMGTGAWKRLQLVYDQFRENKDENLFSFLKNELNLIKFREKFD